MKKILISYLSIILIMFIVSCGMEELLAASTQSASQLSVETKSKVSLNKSSGNQIVNGHVEVPIEGIIGKIVIRNHRWYFFWWLAS